MIKKKKKRKALLLNKPNSNAKLTRSFLLVATRIKNKQANNRQIKHRQHTYTHTGKRNKK